MILLAALILGLLTGWGLARWRGFPYRAPEFDHIWLLPAAFGLQVVGLYWKALPGWAASALHLASLVGFLAFTWVNRRLAGLPVMIIGLVLNLAVIAANGGWMPLSPETASQLPGGRPAEAAVSGTRVDDKSILLRPEETRLEFLADRYLLPPWFGTRAALSLGDMFIAAGAFWLLANPSATSRPKRSENA